MANKRPDIYEHNNPDLAIVDSNFLRGGRRVVANRAELYALASKADQLKENVTVVRVLSDNENSDDTTELLLIDDSQIGSPTGWEVYSVGGAGGNPTDPGADFVLYSGTGQNTDGSMTQKATTDALLGKVDKVAGQGLISESEKTRLAALTQYTDDQARQANNTRITAVEQSVAAKASTTYVDAGDTASRARANHTGTQPSTTISDFTEAVQDAVASLLSAGTNITLAYDDAGNRLVIAATGAGATDPEVVRDTIGAALKGVGLISVTVDDTADTITVSTTATQNSTDAQLRDRATHTGTQAISTVSGLQGALDNKSDAGHNHDGRYVRTVNGIAPTNGNVDVPTDGGGGSVTPVQNPGTSTTAVMSQDATTKLAATVVAQIFAPSYYQGMDVAAGQRKSYEGGVYRYDADATNVQQTPDIDPNATLLYFYAKAVQTFTKLTLRGPNQAATDAASIENDGNGNLLLRDNFRVGFDEIYHQGNARFKADGVVILDGGQGVQFAGKTQAQREAISNPTDGRKVYQTDGDKGYYTYQDGLWSKDGSFGEINTRSFLSIGDNGEELLLQPDELNAYVSLSIYGSATTKILTLPYLPDSARARVVINFALDSTGAAQGTPVQVRQRANTDDNNPRYYMLETIRLGSILSVSTVPLEASFGLPAAAAFEVFSHTSEGGGAPADSFDPYDLTGAQIDEAMALPYDATGQAQGTTPSWTKIGHTFNAVYANGDAYRFIAERGNYIQGDTTTGAGPVWQRMLKLQG